MTSSKNSPFEAVSPFWRQAGHVFPDMSSRVEPQKRNQPAIEKWPFGFVFGVQLGLRQRPTLIKAKKNFLVLISACVSAEGRVEHQKLSQTAAMLLFG